MSNKFKKKYVLGEGYPRALGLQSHYDKVFLCKESSGSDLIALNFPDELWTKEMPKYRLVLERINKIKKATQNL